LDKKPLTCDTVEKRKSPMHKDCLPLFLVNLRLIRDWYTAKQERGPELGQNVLLEIVFADVTLALELADRGKTWAPPK
jgi:hypothetical protein